ERARLMGEHVHQRLAPPPDGGGDELDVAGRVEPPRRFDQPEVAFVNEVEERHAEAAIALRVGDDEPQVRLDEPRDRFFVALVVDAVAERALLVRVETRQLRDLAQVGAQGTHVVVTRRRAYHATFAVRRKLSDDGRDRWATI